MRLPFILALAVLFSVAFSSCSSPKTTAQFYQSQKRKQGVTNFKLPGWAVWTGAGVARLFVKEPQAKAALKLARKTGKIRFMTTEEAGLISNQDLTRFVGELKQNGYEDLIQIRERNTLVNIMARDKKDKLRNLLVMVNEEDSFVFFDIKSRLKYEEIGALIEYFIERDNQEEEQAPQEVKPPVKEDTEPRA
jgi:hypothetical protein